MKKVSMRPFSPTQSASRRKLRSRQQRAQSLTVAVIVLFLLLFLAGLFIVLVVNNLRDAKGNSQRVQSNHFAQGGLDYLNDQLVKSAEGADWRPQPDCAFNVPCTNLAANDPDYEWLQPITLGPTGLPKVDSNKNVIGGFRRISFNGGRALVRVSYRPRLKDSDVTPAEIGTLEPTSKYIKLESIGRVGEIDPKDPTTYRRTEIRGMRRELFAFKQIGLTDYLWQVTNKDGKASSVGLGVTRKVTTAPTNPDGTRPQPGVGDVDVTGQITNATLRPQANDIESIFYGPIRINAGLNFHGKSRFFLDSRRADAIEVAGQIHLETGAQGFLSNLNPASPVVSALIQDSDSGAFNTYNGLLRDNPRGAFTEGLPDGSGNPNLRAISTTTTPVIDNVIGSGDLTRYRLLTRNAEPLRSALGAAPYYTGAGGVDEAGSKGWGKGLYIPNRDDVQQASLTLGGAYSLRADWLNPNPDRLGAKSYWQTSSRYIPPAVEIELFPRYMKITRYDKATTNYLWNAAGAPVANTTIVRYTPVAANPAPSVGVVSPLDTLEGYPEGDYTIFAEGNIRIKGVVGGLDAATNAYFLRHLTVVSNGTIYVDGNLLRDNIAPGAADPRNIKGQSSLALLAKDYVCVNTTQFLASVGGTPTKEDVGSAVPEAYTLERDPSGSTRREMSVQFAAVPVEQFASNGTGISGLVAPTYFNSLLVMMRHSSTGNPIVPSDQGPAPINVLVNGNDLFGGPAINPTTSLVANPRGTIDAGGLAVRSQSGEYLNEVAGMTTPPLAAGTLAGQLGQNNRLTVSYDQDSGVADPKNYRNSRVGIVPMDIRIEALMYAQEGSFFVIPGPWFNPDPNDTYERFIVKGNRRAGDSDLVIPGVPRINSRYPFYGEPQDVRLTIFGGVSQNISAEAGDQTEWMTKWGWVPNHYGSTGLVNGSGAPTVAALSTVHGRNGAYPGPLNTLTIPAFAGTTRSMGSGLLYLFDDRMIAPYGPTGPLRPNPYNPTEPLPIVPNLPVAPGLLYKGENPVQ
jgi:hypothetical protein